MSRVLGIDLSSFAVDLVAIDEEGDEAVWHRVTLGDDKVPALDRLRSVPGRMPPASFYDDVYLVAIEAPYGRGEAGTQAKLNRVFGAVIASLPVGLLVWEVTAGDWRKGLGLKGNATKEECAAAVTLLWRYAATHFDVPQDALDAFAIARYARDVNAAGVEANLLARPLELF